MSNSIIYKYLPAQTITDFSSGNRHYITVCTCTVEIADRDTNVVEVTIVELIQHPFGDDVSDETILRALKPSVPVSRLSLEKRFHPVPDMGALDDEQLEQLRLLSGNRG